MAARTLTRARRHKDRTKTDQSLRLERRKADLEIEKRASRARDDADRVVGTARTRAAAVLAEARRLADEGPARARRSDPSRIRRARAEADAELQREYAAADARLGRERANRVRVLAKLFLAERQITDRRLQLERARSDDLVASRDELLAQVSHDLRGFLGAIALRAELLHSSLPAKAAPHLGEAIEGIRESLALMGRD